MKLMFTFIISVLSFFCMGQTPERAFDEKSQTQILIGATDPKYLLEGEFGFSYNTEFANYHADTTQLAQLSVLLQAEDIQLTIVLATWCGDSKEQVPRFYKINSLLKVPFQNIKIICVDRQKKAGSLDIAELKIEKVPTFIFSRNGVEIGRITETPLVTIESDILKILSTKLLLNSKTRSER